MAFSFAFVMIAAALATAAECIPNNDASNSSIAQWAASVDSLADSALRKPDPNDKQTPFGTIIDESCFNGLSKMHALKRRYGIERALAVALTQAERCKNIFGISEYSSVVTKLRRTKIYCTKEVKTSAASAKMQDPHDPEHAAGWSQHYDLVDWSYMQDQSSVMDNAAALVHEALHWGANNNISAHNDFNDTNAISCKKSLYTDRVYLLGAACFPNSKHGITFYGSQENKAYTAGLDCAGVCESAFTKVEKEKLEAELSKTLIASPLSAGQAKTSCDRMRSWRTRYFQINQERATFHKSYIGTLSWIRHELPYEGQNKLVTAVYQLGQKSEDYFTGKAIDRAALLKETASLLKLTQDLFSKNCPDKEGHWKNACSLSSNPIESWLKRTEALVKDWKQDDLLLLDDAK